MWVVRLFSDLVPDTLVTRVLAYLWYCGVSGCRQKGVSLGSGGFLQVRINVLVLLEVFISVFIDTYKRLPDGGGTRGE